MAEAEDEFQHALKKNMFQMAAFAFKVEEINQAMAEVKQIWKKTRPNSLMRNVEKNCGGETQIKKTRRAA